MARTIVCTTVAFLVLAAAANAAPTTNRTLAFKTVTHGTVPWKLSNSMPSGWAQTVNRVMDAPGQGEEVDFRTYFGVYAYVMRPTSGYSLTIRKVIFQRFGSYTQICTVVVVGKPTGAATQQRHMSAHYVKIKRGRIGFNVPDHIVLRERGARVLYATPGSRNSACK